MLKRNQVEETRLKKIIDNLEVKKDLVSEEKLETVLDGLKIIRPQVQMI